MRSIYTASALGAAVLLCLLASTAQADWDQCTAMLFTPKSTVDGSAMTTHTADCNSCDSRISLVPRKKHRAGSQANIPPGRGDYPKYVGYERGDTYYPENLVKGPKFFKWPETQPIASIEQVPETHQYIDGLYGIINEHQLAMGESTCGARLFAIPKQAGGKATVDMPALTRFAMERACSAREAIRIMGELGQKYGFFGESWSGFVGNISLANMEAGEALTIIDPNEAWVFHIMPDDTGSAVWAAQRVPEGHVAVVANEFIIKEIDFNDSDNFMWSDNILTVAQRNGFWTSVEKDGPFNFRRVYTYANPWHIYCSRRMWRVQSLLAPSLNLNPDASIDELPFSVKPEIPVTLDVVLALQRDHMEGTKFDLRRGPAAGPFGNPNRYDRGVLGGQDMSQLQKGTFERAISLFRTVYSFAAQARKDKPREIGARVWFGMGAPHATVYSPLFPNSENIPAAYKFGSHFKLDRRSLWWAVTSVANWAERAFFFIHQDVVRAQNLLETNAQQIADKLDNAVMNALTSSQDNNNNEEEDNAANSGEAIIRHVTRVQNALGNHAARQWWHLLDLLMTKYHDGYAVLDFTQDHIQLKNHFYPVWWLKLVGFWKDPQNIPASEGALDAATRPFPEAMSVQALQQTTTDALPPLLQRLVDSLPSLAKPSSSSSSPPAASEDVAAGPFSAALNSALATLKNAADSTRQLPSDAAAAASSSSFSDLLSSLGLKTENGADEDSEDSSMPSLEDHLIGGEGDPEAHQPGARMRHKHGSGYVGNHLPSERTDLEGDQQQPQEMLSAEKNELARLQQQQQLQASPAPAPAPAPAVSTAGGGAGYAPPVNINPPAIPPIPNIGDLLSHVPAQPPSNTPSTQQQGGGFDWSKYAGGQGAGAGGAPAAGQAPAGAAGPAAGQQFDWSKYAGGNNNNNNQQPGAPAAAAGGAPANAGGDWNQYIPKQGAGGAPGAGGSSNNAWSQYLPPQASAAMSAQKPAGVEEVVPNTNASHHDQHAPSTSGHGLVVGAIIGLGLGVALGWRFARSKRDEYQPISSV